MRRFVFGLVLFLGFGCRHAAPVLDSFPPGSVRTPEGIGHWARASPPRLEHVNPAADMGMVADAGCPKEMIRKDGATLRGGCSTQGTSWFGTASVSESNPDAGVRETAYRFDDFGFEKQESCGDAGVVTSMRSRGTIRKVTAGDLETFELDLVVEKTDLDAGTCSTVTTISAWDYRGSETKATQEWNGRGRVGDSIQGVASLETLNERDNSDCSHEAESGTTTIRAGADTAVITYDGATKCDQASTVTWTLNGVPQGAVRRVLRGSQRSSLPRPVVGGGGALAWRCSSEAALALAYDVYRYWIR